MCSEQREENIWWGGNLRQHTKIKAWVLDYLSSPKKWKKVLDAQSYLTLCDPVDYSPPGSSVHGILWARILEWGAILFSRGYSQPRDQTHVSCILGRSFTVWASREALLLNQWTNTHTTLSHKWPACTARA